MRQRTIIAESRTPDGEALTLTVEDGAHVVRVRREVLMSSRLCGSEQTMAKFALSAGAPLAAPKILVGGLGMGFTLSALLKRVGTEARISVVELLADVVHWNRGPLAGHANYPLEDPRVNVMVGDVVDYLTASAQKFDALVLDIDNGPEAFTVRANGRLYSPAGIALLYRALNPSGIMVLWSAFRSLPFEKGLRHAGFVARSVTARARADVAKGARHTLFVAHRPPGT